MPASQRKQGEADMLTLIIVLTVVSLYMALTM